MSTTPDGSVRAGGVGLRGAEAPLTELYDVILLDLDGVVYIGPEAVPGAPEHLAAARARGARLAFVTNNAARPPAVVAEHLTRLDVPCHDEDVITSAQAAAHHLRSRLSAGARVLRIGGQGLTEALLAEELLPVDALDDLPVAVVQGFSPDLGWRHLAEAARAVRAGLPWVATNLDPTVPVQGGPAPGNGALVGTVRIATGVEPLVVGKPEPALFAEAVRRTGAHRPLMVGDRLDTDLEGARRAGMSGLFVLTGVHGVADLLIASPGERPSYVARDLGGLLEVHPEVTVAPGPDGRVSASCRAAEVVLTRGRLAASPSPVVDPVDLLRAAAAAAWSSTDHGQEPDVSALTSFVTSALVDSAVPLGDVAGRR
ncbi:HAD-IIA family hydrolase [Kineococcus glutinatus]|uniref:HAD hydrolase-like protein n=1 Tax=Kineococcus glutinatus TaxID=1070872 RepID=A0ABP9I8R0_9ACTN